MSLAWLLAQGEQIVPIPGTKRLDRVQENLGALQVTLSADDLAEIERISPRTWPQAAASAHSDKHPPFLVRIAPLAVRMFLRTAKIDLIYFRIIDYFLLFVIRFSALSVTARFKAILYGMAFCTFRDSGSQNACSSARSKLPPSTRTTQATSSSPS